MSFAFVGLESRKKSRHTNANSIVQLLALNEADVLRGVPRKSVKG